MKKLLVLTMVTGIVVLTPAAMQISVEGDLDPLDSEITIFPSDTLTLNIHGSTIGECWILFVDLASGSLNFNHAILQGDFSWFDHYYIPWYGLYYIGHEHYEDWWDFLSVGGGGIGNQDSSEVSGVLVDGIIYHAESAGDAIVELWTSSSPFTSGDWGDWILQDTVVIHQIPEPVTMVLLGLGGILISRRRKGEQR